ncbi:hypothetical protein A2U01_0109038, partial [Trifolium medium]|nr:hypothetical protein [Trifolium medium]
MLTRSDCTKELNLTAQLA